MSPDCIWFSAHCLEQWFSKCGSYTSNSRIIWELFRDVNSCFPLGGSNACSKYVQVISGTLMSYSSVDSSAAKLVRLRPLIGEEQ